MSDLSLTSLPATDRMAHVPTHAERPIGNPTVPTARGADSVEFSDHVHMLHRLKESLPVRQDMIDRVRGEIDAGTYVTPERVDGAIDEILRDFDELP